MDWGELWIWSFFVTQTLGDRGNAKQRSLEGGPTTPTLRESPWVPDLPDRKTGKLCCGGGRGGGGVECGTERCRPGG